MSKLRPTTIKEIESILDQSYFTRNSFTVTNDPIRKTFLIIEFIPVAEYKFFVKASIKSYSYTTSENPGIYMESEESYKRNDFNLVKHAITAWVDRIKEDLDSRIMDEEGIEIFLNKLRKSFENHENDEGYFNKKEIIELLEKLQTLENTILEQAKKLETPENTINDFINVLNDVKSDLPKYQKSVWYKIAGNKVIRSIKSIICSSSMEERKLLDKEIRKLIERKK